MGDDYANYSEYMNVWVDVAHDWLNNFGTKIFIGLTLFRHVRGVEVFETLATVCVFGCGIHRRACITVRTWANETAPGICRPCLDGLFLLTTAKEGV